MKHNYKYTVQITITDASGGEKTRLATRWGYFAANVEPEDIPDSIFFPILEHIVTEERSKTNIKGVDE